MMSVRSKSKKLTTSTTSMGRPKNSSSTSDQRRDLQPGRALAGILGRRRLVQERRRALDAGHVLSRDDQDETNSFQRRVR